MGKQTSSPSIFVLFRKPAVRMLTCTLLGMTVTWSTLDAGDILRGGASSATTTSTSPTGSGTTAPATTMVPSSQDRLARTTQALTAVKNMQAAAHALAVTGANNLKPTLPVVPANSYGVTNGLVLAAGVPKDLLNVKTDGSENAALWTGAKLPTVAGDTSATTVAIVQTSQQALLSWDSFNIGKSTTLNFDQSAGGADVGQWIAFNKIGVTGAPSQILGSIKADGQVYVINPNGIIFGGSSQVNAHALVASSLPINSNLVKNGLLNNSPNYEFLFSAADIDKSGKTTATGVDAFGHTSTDPDYVAPLLNEAYGDVVVQAGAILSAPSAEGNVGGRIALIGPNVTNAGTISTENGQTILAAGLQVGFNAHDGIDPTRRGVQVKDGVLGSSQPDPTLRGLDVYVGAVVNPSANTADPTKPNYSPLQFTTEADGGSGLGNGWAGVVTNANRDGQSGLIEAAQGNVTLVGAVVNQLGFINSSTSVALNGRVDLLANFNAVSRGRSLDPASFEPFFQNSSGLVTFGAGSVTQILPVASKDTVVGTQLALPSQLTVQAQSIHLAGSADSGALVLAPSGHVTMTAGNWRSPEANNDTSFVPDGGQIFLDSGAAVDVSGSQNVSASVAENIVSVQLRGPELADSPLQRNGVLRGDTIQIDVRETGTYNGQAWVGTPLADTTGYIGLIQRTVGELTTDGGTVNLTAGSSVVMQSGSAINVSGGSIAYQGATIQTTELLSGGHIYDISKATPDRVYDSIYTGTTTTTDPKWGVTTTTGSGAALSHYEAGYTQGGNGGMVTLMAPSIAPDGSLLGYTAAGSRQINAANPSALKAAVAAKIDPRIWGLSTTPAPAGLFLVLQSQRKSVVDNSYVWSSPLAPDILIGPSGAGLAKIASFDANSVGDASTWARQKQLVLSPDLVGAPANPTETTSGGFGTLNIGNSDGTITVAAPVDAAGKSVAGPAMTMLPGGSLTLAAAKIDVEGGIVTAGGTINLLAYDYSPYTLMEQIVTAPSTPVYDKTRGQIILGATATLSTAGLILDRRVPAEASVPLIGDGAQAITLKANEVDLKTGSVIDVSGAVAVLANGGVAYGKAGAIQISSGQDPFAGNLAFNSDGSLNANEVSSSPKNALLGGGLQLGAVLNGFSGLKGGTLSLQAPGIQIGGPNPNTVSAIAGSVFWMPQDGAGNVSFFSQGGFTAFNLTGLGSASGPVGNPTYSPGLVIKSDVTNLHPIVQSWIAEGSNGVTLTTQPLGEGLRPAVGLKFTVANIKDYSGTLAVRGDLVMEAGAKIQVDPVAYPGTPAPAPDVIGASPLEGSVTLGGDTVAVAGTILAPGGTISILGKTSLPLIHSSSQDPLPTVDLKSTSLLSTAGAVVLVGDQFGGQPGDTAYQPTGSVLSGGTVKVQGNIVAESGAVIDVSGASGSLLLPLGFTGTAGPSLNPLTQYSLTSIDTNGGVISLAAGQELFSAATLKAFSGNLKNPKAIGGSLSVSSGQDTFQKVSESGYDVTLVLTQKPTDFQFKGLPGAGNHVLDKAGNPITAVPDVNDQVTMSFFDADSFNNGGFASMSLQRSGSSPTGSLSFSGPVNILATGTLSLGDAGVLGADGKVSLQGSYVSIGQGFQAPLSTISRVFAPTYGTGSLMVTASKLIDIGNVSLQGIGAATFDAGNGDIRGDGTLAVAGHINLQAGQIYPPSAVTFNVAAYDYLPADAKKNLPGTVTIGRPTNPVASQIPLSAGGTLAIYASTIDQGGVLRAPFGTITLGTTDTVNDLFTLQVFPTTQNLTLENGSLTSTSGATQALTDPVTGKPVATPYGVNLNGTAWFDPTGTNITVTGNGGAGLGLPSQQVRLASTKILDQAGATIDIAGGGDLSAYQWVPGVGGTKDVLNSTTSFAVIPAYAAHFAPYAPNSASPADVAASTLWNADSGYFNPGLSIGSQIHLNASSGLPAGDYTLLPARYALVPGAFLVTPKSGLPVNTVVQPDGSTVVSGYLFNGLTGGAVGSALNSNFEVASYSVVKNRAEYVLSSANTFFPQQAVANDQPVPSLPVDAGQLVLAATGNIALQGSVAAQAGSGGRGGLIDISSPEDIVINATGTGKAADTLYLSTGELSHFNAESLLIGGTRTVGSGSAGTVVSVSTDNLSVDNAGAGNELTGSDVILVANKTLTLAPGANVSATSATASTVPADPLRISDTIVLNPTPGNDAISLTHGGAPVVFGKDLPSGDVLTPNVDYTITSPKGIAVDFLANTAINTLDAGSSVTLKSSGTIAATFNPTGDPIPVVLGDGTLLRVSSAPSAPTTRSGVIASAIPTLTIEAGAAVKGAAVTLDSTATTNLASNAVLSGGTTSLASGQISLVLDGTGANPPAAGSLVLNSQALTTLQTGATGVSLLSYSSIDLYGAGRIGASTLTNLALHAGEIRGFNLGSDDSVVLAAKNISIDNSPGSTGAGAGPINSGTFSIQADNVITLGANQFAIDNFAAVKLSAADGILLRGAGGFTTPADLTLTTPLIAGEAAANQTVTTAGKLQIDAPASGIAKISGGLGANLTLTGANVTANSGISLPSGALTIHATATASGAAGVSVGGLLDVGGQTKTLNDLVKSTSGGTIALTTESGDVTLGKTGVLNVGQFMGDTGSWAGNGGTVSIAAPTGGFKLDGKIHGQGGGSDQNGSFALDVAGLRDSSGQTTSSLSGIETALIAGGFTRGQSLRVRTGQVNVDSAVKAQAFSLSADAGSIDVAGKIDASGPTGGTIDLVARGSVTLESTAILDAHGQNFDNAGKGGAITLEAGSETQGTVPSTSDPRDASTRMFPRGTAIVDVQAGSTVDLSIVNDHPVLLNTVGNSSITLPANIAVFFPSGTPGNDQVAFNASGTITTADGAVTTFTATATRTFSTTLALGSTVKLATAGAVTFASGSGGSIPVNLPSALVGANLTDLAAYNTTGTLTLRAPQNVDATDVQINPIVGNIVGASNIVAEGVKVFDQSSLTGYGIDVPMEQQVMDNGTKFATTNAGQIQQNLLQGSTIDSTKFHLRPSEEIINSTGNLTLNNIWDLSGFRFGAVPIDPVSGNPVAGAGEPGTLTLRAAGNIIFAYNGGAGSFASLSDGFGTGAPATTATDLWQSILLPVGSESWSYRLVAGADFSAVNFRQVLPVAQLLGTNPAAGSLQLGDLTEPDLEQSAQDLRSVVVPNFYQVIRTGTGKIDIASGLDVQSLNPLATIYTAGKQAPALPGFDAPDLSYSTTGTQLGASQGPVYPAQYSFGGGNIMINAQRDIVQSDVVNNAQIVADSSKQMPTNWLYRRGYTDSSGKFAIVPSGNALDRRGNPAGPNRQGTPDIASTSWWVDYSNFFEGVGALGGGNVSLVAGNNISNVDAVVPTNARATGFVVDAAGQPVLDAVTGQRITLKPAGAPLLQLGGGDLVVQAGRNLDAGVYYVERGSGTLAVADTIHTNTTRSALLLSTTDRSRLEPINWLPTTLFLGDGNMTVNAGGDVQLGPVANPFLLPQGLNNSFWEKTYFSTFAARDSVDVNSLTGSIVLQDSPARGGASLASWYGNILLYDGTGQNISYATNQPWLRLVETSVADFGGDYANTNPKIGAFDLMPPSLRATAFTGDLNLVGGLTLAPSSSGTVDLVAAGAINGLQANVHLGGADSPDWSAALINLSDADPARIPGVSTPLSLANTPAKFMVSYWSNSQDTVLDGLNVQLSETGATQGPKAALQAKAALHAPGLLHLDDPNPIHLYAQNGSISGLTLYSGKAARITAGKDVTDIALYVQNDHATDTSVISAGRDIITYDPNSPLLSQAGSAGAQGASQLPRVGDIQISGPGTLEILAGRDLNLGTGVIPDVGTGLGVTSIGNARNPALSFAGADIVAAAGLGAPSALASSPVGFTDFIKEFLDPSTAGGNAAVYLPELAKTVGLAVDLKAAPQVIWDALLASFSALDAGGKAEALDRLALNGFFLVLRDSGRDRNNPNSPNFKTFAAGYQAIKDMFSGSRLALEAPADTKWSGSISLATREIETINGGNITLLAPGGSVTVGRPSDPQKSDQGVLTAHGGTISIFAQDSVNVGTSRIFTLFGGSEVIWSSVGDIAAGSGSKTVFSAPPTRVLVDPQSGNIQNDLAGLSTGGGIGVLATLTNVAAGDVDLIAPVGTIDAGDAGIRSSGNLNLAANIVLNASNISVGGATAGAPPPPAAPNLGGLTAASNSAAASSSSANEVGKQNQPSTQATVLPSVISVEVLGYGGGDGGDSGDGDDKDKDKDKTAAEQPPAVGT